MVGAITGDGEGMDEEKMGLTSTPREVLSYFSAVVAPRGKSGPALGGTEYRLMPSAYRLIVRVKL